MSRTEAQEAVRAGLVTVGGRSATKAATLVGADEPIHLGSDVRTYVSRGGDKLAAALDRFGIDVQGLDCLDAGASTGGFTDCLIKRGAARVVAVDVGYGQLDWGLRTDSRVTVLERTNVRELSPSDIRFTPAMVVADVSFISLTLVLPALVSVSSPRATFVLLVKPQFEAGRELVEKRGVVRDPRVWGQTIERVAGCCREQGLAPQGVTASPLLGPAGNVEFLLWARRGGDEIPIDLGAAIDEGSVLRGTG